MEKLIGGFVYNIENIVKNLIDGRHRYWKSPKRRAMLSIDSSGFDE
jgi:hypothetical protein